MSSHDEVLLLTSPAPATLNRLNRPGASTVNLRGKCQRKVDEFTSALQQYKPKLVSGILKSSYFDVLEQVDVDLEC